MTHSPDTAEVTRAIATGNEVKIREMLDRLGDDALLRELSWPALTGIGSDGLHARRSVLQAEVELRCMRTNVATMTRLSESADKLQGAANDLTGRTLWLTRAQVFLAVAALVLAVVMALAR